MNTKKLKWKFKRNAFQHELECRENGKNIKEFKNRT